MRREEAGHLSSSSLVSAARPEPSSADSAEITSVLNWAQRAQAELAAAAAGALAGGFDPVAGLLHPGRARR
jgi:hypothetical protein